MTAVAVAVGGRVVAETPDDDDEVDVLGGPGEYEDEDGEAVVWLSEEDVPVLLPAVDVAEDDEDGAPCGDEFETGDEAVVFGWVCDCCCCCWP